MTASIDRDVPSPQLADYASACRSFDWDGAWEHLGDASHPARGVNIADVAVDRHVRAGRGDAVAMRWLGRDDAHVASPVEVTYEALALRTNRFASALQRRGFEPGGGLATLTGRVPELYVAALGALKAQMVFTPLFSAFGPDPIAQRVELGRITVLVTNALQFRRKIAGMLNRLPTVELIVITDATEHEVGRMTGTTSDTGTGPAGPEVVAFGVLIGEGTDRFDIPATDVDTPALLHFTSGTTGTPKGAVHVHGAVVAHAVTGRMVLDMHPGDVYWCTADPGWVTGTSYGIIAPLANGVTTVVDEAEFDAERWYRILERLEVNVWYTAPTAIRMLQRRGIDLVQRFDLSPLRLVASVGEPLDAESVVWCGDAFGVPVLDTWWQTETGAIMIANFRSHPVRPGSMGVPIPGIEAALLARTADGELVLDGGQPVFVETPGSSGELALRAGWPSMFRQYLDRPGRYAAAFVDGWYRTGDLARRDEDGYYWFVARGDDVIKTAGHLVGPFEVESALNEHAAIVESGVIGVPDEIAGAVVKAFVVLHEGFEPSDALRQDLLGHARRKLGPAVAPRGIEFADALPHTRSGKIMRRVLSARELGGDVGDISTLEPAPSSDRPVAQQP